MSNEMALLGSILLVPDVLDEVLPIVWPNDFHDAANAKIFEHMRAMHKSNVRIERKAMSSQPDPRT